MTNGSLRFKWTMRAIALSEFFMLAIANLVRIGMMGSTDFCQPALLPDPQAKARTSETHRPLFCLARF